MSWLPGICPNCGGKLQIDPSKDAAICEYCNTPFVTEKAIHIYNNPTIIAENVIINNPKSDFKIIGGRLIEYKGSSNIIHIPDGVG